MFKVYSDNTLIAKFRTMHQIETWGARKGLNIADLNITFHTDSKSVNSNEWVHVNYI